jgi:hypothetical protein
MSTGANRAISLSRVELVTGGSVGVGVGVGEGVERVQAGLRKTVKRRAEAFCEEVMESF